MVLKIFKREDPKVKFADCCFYCKHYQLEDNGTPYHSVRCSKLRRNVRDTWVCTHFKQKETKVEK